MPASPAERGAAPPTAPGAWGLERLYPGYFALVMATGIISTAFLETGQGALSLALLALAVAAYLVLAAAFLMRLARYRASFLADTRDGSRAFGFFTLTAASDVLGLRLAAGGAAGALAPLAVVAASTWVLCSYGLVPRVMLRERKSPPRAEVTGGWLIWVVATQSLALSSSRLATLWPGGRDFLAASAVSLWAAGCCLYLLLMATLLARLLLLPAERSDLSPTYWINMGATAISVLAGASIASAPSSPALVHTLSAFVSGLSFTLWAFGTWWFPLLIVLSVWRAWGGRGLRAYDPSLWSVVFPLGMYSVATMALGRDLGAPSLLVAGRGESWLALAGWLGVALMMALNWSRRQRPAGLRPA